ncbi:MAG TPA: arginine--tRNA ligase, partial [Fimbriimonadaceae bacterium]|nr:arginine--tRNA ligase [Fimbriimonadaceae bacterium]
RPSGGEGAGGEGLIASVDIAGPGFLNFRLRPEAVAAYVAEVLRVRRGLANTQHSTLNPQKINVEFVSVNPNGPITVGSGRGAAFGDTLCRVLAAAGHQVHREYYINDGVNSEQMRLFAESVRAYVMSVAPPDKGYKGEYVQQVASRLAALALIPGTVGDVPVYDLTEDAMSLRQSILDQLVRSAKERNAPRIRLTRAVDSSSIYLDQELLGSIPFEHADAIVKSFLGYGTYAEVMAGKDIAVRLRTAEGDIACLARHARWKEGEAEIVLDFEKSEPGLPWFQSQSQQLMLERQRSDLAAFGVAFDTWFSEQSLHDSGAVQRQLDELKAKGVADEKPERRVLKLAKKGVIEEVEIQEQPVEDDEGGTSVPDVVSSGVPPEAGQPRDEAANLGRDGQATLWLRSTKFGDDMDRVLRRKDGRLTYIASDVAYHRDKLTDESGTRGTGEVDKMITILGPDHHGYIGRLTAVVAALLESEPPRPSGGERAGGEGLTALEAKLYRSPEERDACLAALEEAKRRLEVVIFQIVRFMKDGKPAPMRKRDGNIYELRDLIDELGAAQAPDAPKEEQQRIGRDVARFFYLMRSHDTHMDFDIDLATKQSDENPVFYVQYAHARISSVLRKAEEAGFRHGDQDLGLLNHPREQALIKKILDLPYEVERCAADYGVHRLTTYAVDLARTFHHFYDACRVIQPDQSELTQARLALCKAAQIALQTTLEDLLGVSAPERMERTDRAEVA